MIKGIPQFASICVSLSILLSGCGPKMSMIVGFAKDGGFDTYSRAIAQHMAKYIPDKLPITVENMPGLGSLIAANYAYKALEPDGLTISTFHGGLIMQQLLGSDRIKFDARRFEWIGVPVKHNIVCALTKAGGITSVDKWMASKTPVKLGGAAPGTPQDDTAKVLKVALGLPIQLVSGYLGTAGIRVAAERGEIAGGCWEWESIRLTWRKAIDAGDVVIVLQATPSPHPELPNVPVAIDYAKTKEAKKLIQAGIHDVNAIMRLYAMPPGTPKERVQILRKAFMDTMRDPEFLSEARRWRLDIDPLPGEDVERIVSGLFKLDPALVAKLRDILR